MSELAKPDFGTLKKPNLEAFDTELESRLRLVRGSLSKEFTFGAKGESNKGIGVYTIGKFENILGKPYVAVAVVDVHYTVYLEDYDGDVELALARKDVKLLDDGHGVESLEETKQMYVVVLKPGQGTGNTKDGHTLEEITALDPRLKLKHREVKCAYVPRDKPDETQAMEVAIPLFSVHTDQGNVSNRVMLQGVTLKDDLNPLGRKRLVLAYDLNTTDYRISDKDITFQLTKGFRRDGEQFGNPHAIIHNHRYNPTVANDIQVIAFLAMDRGSLMGEFFDNVAIKPPQMYK